MKIERITEEKYYEVYKISKHYYHCYQYINKNDFKLFNYLFGSSRNQIIELQTPTGKFPINLYEYYFKFKNNTFKIFFSVGSSGLISKDIHIYSNTNNFTELVSLIKSTEFYYWFKNWRKK